MPTEIITITEDERLRLSGFEWREQEAGVRALICTPLSERGFVNAFSTRTGGVSPLPDAALNLAGFDDDSAENIHENRRRFLSLLGLRLDAWRLATAWQVHGSDVVQVATADYVNDRLRCDALTTNMPGTLVAVKTADCVPMLLADESTGACAAVHAGWRGTLGRIIERTLTQMRNLYGTRPSDVRAGLGAAALGCCYEVGAEVTDAFEKTFGESYSTPTRDGHALIDLHRANCAQLEGAGVSPDRIHRAPYCTMCRPDLFFSYRRDKQLHNRTGRLLAVIGRE